MLHREGFKIITLSLIALLALNALVFFTLPIILPLIVLASVVFWGLIIQFFRNPKRPIPLHDDRFVYAPADGKVVVIERTVEDEYLKDERIQVSIFMSPLNVHVNRTPFGSVVRYFRYHPGKYLVAWHPKSSTENERSTIVLEREGQQVLLRQIAGAVARRIRTYVVEGQTLAQGEEFGFITFGSRVDLFLPLDAEIVAQIDDVVKGNQSIIAKLAK